MNVYDNDNKNAAKVLKRVNPKLPYGTELFNELARITIGIAIEAVILRNTPKGKEIFLSKRKEEESYGGLWHCPGTFLRTGETTESAFTRLEEKEDIGKILNKKFAGFDNNLHEKRGHVVHLIFACEVETFPNSNGAWFLIDALPVETVDHHKMVVIPMALSKF
jgi:ADP-ribose pyrophosphatase YjhB (NUDIX family)